jgi:hypothetical protein
MNLIGYDNATARVGWRGLDASGSGYGPVAGSCGHGNEPSGSIKRGGFRNQLFYC